jgi:putative transcriptional regulator
MYVGGIEMHIAIDSILKEQNKTRFWLSKEVDCNYQSLCNLCNNNSTSITFSLLIRLCKALNCSPNDIIKIEE